MTVYVESNFVLELALDQEQASDAHSILNHAERGSISLVIPAFALSEPFGAVRRKNSERNTLLGLLRDQVKALGRSQYGQGDSRILEEARVAREEVEQRHTDDLVIVTELILGVATAIPLTSADLRQASEYRTQHGFREIQDAIIYSTIVRHLQEGALLGPHYFVTRDKSAFNGPDVAAELRALACEVLTSFEEAVLRLEQPLPE